MTIPELLERLPLMREWFPKEIQQEWSMEEWERSMQATRQRVFDGLDDWKEKNDTT